MKKQRVQNPPINPLIGERLQRERRRQNLTQAEVAIQAQMSPTVLCRLETGQQAVAAERLAAIARVLGMSLDYLCGLQDSMYAES
jgi:transcriptional regulator with XRE-family HTH domain